MMMGPRTTNLFVFLFATANLTISSVASRQYYVQWIVDDQCPDEGGRRGLQETRDDIIGRGVFHTATASDKKEPGTQSTLDRTEMDYVPFEDSHLRGRDNTKDDESRALQSTTANTVTFNLKLHWKLGYCWQQEMIERKWCLQCPGTTCNSGDYLWIYECNQHDVLQRFELVYLGMDPARPNKHMGLLKVAGEDLCLHQLEPGTFRLFPCDASNEDQKLVGFEPYQPFEIQPAHLNHVDDCLTQDHHPKPYEELRSKPCYVARRDRTSYWEFYKRSETGMSTRNPPCSPNLPCDTCQGDCDKDADCRGTLRCYQRWGQSGSQSIPGCSGVPVDQRKYHYSTACQFACLM